MADRIQDISDTVDKQIAELRSQVATLTKRLAAQARAAGDEASEAAENARGRVRNAITTARQQGGEVADLAREHPAATTSALLTACLIGAAIGYMVGSLGQQQSRRYW